MWFFENYLKHRSKLGRGYVLCEILSVFILAYRLMKKISIFIRDFSHMPQCGTCINRDGTNSGFDIELVKHISENVSIPVIASNGAGKVEYFSEVFEKTDAG